MAGFTKLCSTIITSSVWSEDDATRIVWVTMLAMSDSDGMVDSSLPGLAALSRVTLSECESAVNKLSAPDIYSRNESNEGRRIVAVERGWVILNYRCFNANNGREPMSPEWPRVRLSILLRDNGICAYCGSQADSVDHVLARIRGGSDEPTNLVACCRSCNSKKRERSLREAGMSFRQDFDSSVLSPIHAA